jgi:hypothetical protein
LGLGISNVHKSWSQHVGNGTRLINEACETLTFHARALSEFSSTSSAVLISSEEEREIVVQGLSIWYRAWTNIKLKYD